MLCSCAFLGWAGLGHAVACRAVGAFDARRSARCEELSRVCGVGVKIVSGRKAHENARDVATLSNHLTNKLSLILSGLSAHRGRFSKRVITPFRPNVKHVFVL